MSSFRFYYLMFRKIIGKTIHYFWSVSKIFKKNQCRSVKVLYDLSTVGCFRLWHLNSLIEGCFFKKKKFTHMNQFLFQFGMKSLAVEAKIKRLFFLQMTICMFLKPLWSPLKLILKIKNSFRKQISEIRRNTVIFFKVNW